MLPIANGQVYTEWVLCFVSVYECVVNWLCVNWLCVRVRRTTVSAITKATAPQWPTEAAVAAEPAEFYVIAGRGEMFFQLHDVECDHIISPAEGR